MEVETVKSVNDYFRLRTIKKIASHLAGSLHININYVIVMWSCKRYRGINCLSFV